MSLRRNLRGGKLPLIGRTALLSRTSINSCLRLPLTYVIAITLSRKNKISENKWENQ